MKELSIEEKAKRYDEAKLRMSAAYNSNRCTIGFMNEIFPELAESDDERMRKALIKLVKKVGEGYENVIDGISIENAIAWLEKQGEQKPTEWSEEDDYNLQCCIAKVQNDIDNGRIGMNRELLTWLNSLKNRVGYEVNYTTTKEWSEEDEINLKYTTRIIERLYDKQEKNYLKESLEGKLNWLKSLKDRVQPQPKQEWSEEDIVAIDCAVDVLNKDLPTLAASIKRLKSLRPQSQWKPSDEQMKTLEYYMYTLTCSEHKEILFGLYEDLKKLKG